MRHLSQTGVAFSVDAIRAHSEAYKGPHEKCDTLRHISFFEGFFGMIPTQAFDHH